MWDGVKARIVEDYTEFLNDKVRLVLYQRTPDGVAVLRDDGVWAVIAEGDSNANVGIAIPKEAVEPLRLAIEAYQGAAGNPRTEAAILREWLAVERARVDEALKR